ncbi:nucleotidyltransferase family protein [Oxalobacteraceae bacterium CAVE-383]|nr:nucleotidyltransferase family protein [Oxalobacteraceae bacterium CAVE-383]
MRAMLLAGGYGTRLKPLTNYLPKCLVPIHGRPLLDYWLEALVAGGVTEILVNTHYLAPMVRKFVEGCAWTEFVTLVHEEHLLGTGGTVVRNGDFFGDGPFIVAHADNLTLFDVQDFIDSHLRRPQSTVMTMMTFETDDPKSCGILELDARGVVVAFHEKVANPPGNFANAAVYIFEPALIASMKEIGAIEIDLSTQVIPRLMGKIITFFNDTYHRDIGTIAQWQMANRDFPALPADIRSAAAWENALAGSGEAGLASIIEDLLARG